MPLHLSTFHINRSLPVVAALHIDEWRWWSSSVIVAASIVVCSDNRWSPPFNDECSSSVAIIFNTTLAVFAYDDYRVVVMHDQCSILVSAPIAQIPYQCRQYCDDRIWVMVWLNRMLLMMSIYAVV
jgi:hypothetical protein